MIRRRLCVATAAALYACSSDAEPRDPPAEPAARPSRPAVLSADPIQQAFGNSSVLDGWILVCDNLRVCRAQPRGLGGSLMIRRDPGPNGQLLIVLDGQEPGEPLRPDVTTIRLAGVAAGPPAAPWRFDREADRATLEGEAALAFARTLVQATSLSYDTAEGRLEVPLTGLRETLAAMDEAQGHAGGEAAFVSVGPRPRAELPPAPAMPVIEIARSTSLASLPAGFAASVRRAAREAAECEPETRDLDAAHPLDAADALVILECGHGLTNSSYLLLRAPRDAPARAVPIVLPSVPAADDGHQDVPGLYTNVEWDAAQQSLSSVVRSCMGACGESAEWVFDGRDFRLVAFSFYEAGGAESLDLHRAEIRRQR